MAKEISSLPSVSKSASHKIEGNWVDNNTDSPLLYSGCMLQPQLPMVVISPYIVALFFGLPAILHNVQIVGYYRALFYIGQVQRKAWQWFHRQDVPSRLIKLKGIPHTQIRAHFVVLTAPLARLLVAVPCQPHYDIDNRIAPHKTVGKRSGVSVAV